MASRQFRSARSAKSRKDAINRALWWATLVAEGTLREWLANMGRRPADRRLAHLICELLVRLQSVGFADEHSFEFPLTQLELPTRSACRRFMSIGCCRELRASGLIMLEHRLLTVPDVDRLKKFAEFDPSYLHLTKRKAGGAWCGTPRRPPHGL